MQIRAMDFHSPSGLLLGANPKIRSQPGNLSIETIALLEQIVLRSGKRSQEDIGKELFLGLPDCGLKQDNEVNIS